MRTVDHLILGRFLLDMSEDPGLTRRSRAFLFGCVEPDYNKATYTRGLMRHTKFRGHNAENSLTHIEKCLASFRAESICSAWDYFSLGTMLHYVADAFTFPHNAAFGGSLSSHVQYEHRLHWTLLEELDTAEKEAPVCGSDFIGYFTDAHSAYDSEEHCEESDCRYIIGVCSAMLSGCLRYSGAREDADILTGAILPYENSYHHGLV